VIDEWLSQNPEAQNIYKFIYVTNDLNAAAGREMLTLGERAIDIYDDKIRENTPLTILRHEYEHTQDAHISDEEDKKIKELETSHTPTAQREEFSEYAQEIGRLEKEHVTLLRKEQEEKLGPSELNQLRKERSSKNTEINILKEKYQTFLSKYPETKKLQHFYNEITFSIGKNILDDDNVRRIRDETAEKVSAILSEKYSIDLNKIGKDLKRKDPYYKELSEYDLKLEALRKAAGDLYEKEKTVETTALDGITMSLMAITDSQLESASEEEIIKKIDKILPTTQGGAMSSIFDLQIAIEESKNPDLKKTAIKIKELADNYGLPASYGFFNYGGSGTKYAAAFRELSSTYREEPIEIRRQKANSENNNVRKVYRELTQLAFDSGKMRAEEYKAIMGEICKYPDCRDQKCLLYKMTCQK